MSIVSPGACTTVGAKSTLIHSMLAYAPDRVCIRFANFLVLRSDHNMAETRKITPETHISC